MARSHSFGKLIEDCITLEFPLLGYQMALLLFWPERPWRRIERHLREIKGALQRVEGQCAELDGGRNKERGAAMSAK